EAGAGSWREISGSTSESEAGRSMAPPSACTTRAPDQQLHRVGCPAYDRGGEKEEEAAEEEAAPAEAVRQPSGGDECGGENDRVGVEDHESCASELSGNDARMSGKAMLTIVTSRKVMKTPTEVASNTRQRRAISRFLAIAAAPGRRALVPAGPGINVGCVTKPRQRGSRLYVTPSMCSASRAGSRRRSPSRPARRRSCAASRR